MYLAEWASGGVIVTTQDIDLLFALLKIPYSESSLHIVPDTVDSAGSACSQPLGIFSICILDSVMFVACRPLKLISACNEE